MRGNTQVGLQSNYFLFHLLSTFSKQIQENCLWGGEKKTSSHTKLDIHPFHRKNRGSERVNLHVKARGTELSPTGPSTLGASDKRSHWHTCSSEHLARFKEKLLRDIVHWNKSYKIRQNSCRQPRWGKHKYLKWFTKFSLLYHIAP